MTQRLHEESRLVLPPEEQVSWGLVAPPPANTTFLLSPTHQMATQTSSGSWQMEVMLQLDPQVPVPLQLEGSTSQNLQS